MDLKKQVGNVYGQMTTINMQQKSIRNITAKTVSSVTSQKLTQTASQSTPCSLRDFLAKASALQVNVKDLKIFAAQCSTKLPELLQLKDLHCYCLKTLEDYFQHKTDTVSSTYFKRWMNWGTMSNGAVLTAKISVFPKVGKECSLSDIIETDVPDKYFLSQKQTDYLLKMMRENKESHLVSTPATTKEHVSNVLMSLRTPSRVNPKLTTCLTLRGLVAVLTPIQADGTYHK